LSQRAATRQSSIATIAAPNPREPKLRFRVVVLKLVLGGIMTRGEEYRQYAAECIRVAQQIQNSNDKTMLLDMAQKWRALAAKADSEDGRET
jgi:hypothetical protein